MAKNPSNRPKLARKIDSRARKEKRKHPHEKSRSSFDQAPAPFHPVGEMPSQYTETQSELEKVSRVKRRKEW
jgi:hypothetical protein